MDGDPIEGTIFRWKAQIPGMGLYSRGSSRADEPPRDGHCTFAWKFGHVKLLLLSLPMPPARVLAREASRGVAILTSLDPDAILCGFLPRVRCVHGWHREPTSALADVLVESCREKRSFLRRRNTERLRADCLDELIVLTQDEAERIADDDCRDFIKEGGSSSAYLLSRSNCAVCFSKRLRQGVIETRR